MTADPVTATASQALTIATAAAAALGAKGVPLAVFFGSLNGLLVLFTSEYEQPAPLTLDDLDRAVEKITARIDDAALRQDARNAGSVIRAAFGWYKDFSARAAGGERFTQGDFDDFRHQLLDVLGPNSNLAAAVRLLARPEIGKFATAEFALGASLLLKLRHLELAMQANRGDPVAPVQFFLVQSEATGNGDALRKLIAAADFHIGARLQAWSGQHPRAPREQWLAERDRLVADLYGGFDALDDSRATAGALMRAGAEAQRLATALQVEISRRRTQPAMAF
jgi:hypothetical protein